MTSSLAFDTTLATELAQHLCDRSPVLRVQIGVDLVKEVEGRGIALLDGEDEGEGTECLLSARKLLDALLLVMLGVERDGNAHAREVLHAGAVCAWGFIFRVVIGATVGALLDDEPALACRHKLDEDVLEVLRHLLEGAVDGLVLALIEHFDERFDVISRRVELAAPLMELLALARKVFVLLKGLFVDMRILLQRFVDLVKFADELFCCQLEGSVKTDSTYLVGAPSGEPGVRVFR